MTTDRLELYKKHAKRLKKALQADAPEALARLRAVWDGPADRPPPPTHATALMVIAREAGERSWPALKLSIETAALAEGDRARALERALRGGALRQAERLLALAPRLRTAHLGLAAALGAEEAVAQALAADPQAARRPVGGPPAAPPLAHLCFSRWADADPARRPAMTRIGRRLLAAGADPNAAAPLGDGEAAPALYGAIRQSRLLDLAAALLEAGASPNDNESLYHAAELEDPLPALRLLYAHGARHDRTNALPRMLDHDHLEGARLMLANGADPNEPLRRGDAGDPRDYGNALTHAIRRGRGGAFVELLLEAGADPGARLGGAGAYALARIYGARSAAAALEARGLATPLSPAEACLAAVADLDANAALDLAAAHPGLLAGLHPILKSLAVEWAGEAARLPALKLLHRAGLAPDERGDSDLTPLHMAAWRGLAETTVFYLSIGADPGALNAYGGDALSAALHGSVNAPAGPETDHAATIARLIAGGARIDPARGHLSAGSDEAQAAVEELWEAG